MNKVFMCPGCTKTFETKEKLSKHFLEVKHIHGWKD